MKRGDTKFYHCEECGAHALTVPALRQTIAEGNWSAIWPAIRDAAHGTHRTCPECRRWMRVSAPLEAAGGICIDFCERCRIVWFDPNELTKVPKAPVKDDGLTPEARKALGIALAHAFALEYDKRARVVEDWVSNLFRKRRYKHWRDG